MSVWVLIGKTVAAIFMAATLGAISLFALSHFFAAAANSDTQFSTIGVSGGMIAGFVGLYIGWRWALPVADEVASKLVELLFLGVGALILGVIAFVIKLF